VQPVLTEPVFAGRTLVRSSLLANIIRRDLMQHNNTAADLTLSRCAAVAGGSAEADVVSLMSCASLLVCSVEREKERERLERHFSERDLNVPMNACADEA
jgi:hypothetical protein